MSQFASTVKKQQQIWLAEWYWRVRLLKILLITRACQGYYSTQSKGYTKGINRICVKIKLVYKTILS